MPGMLIDLEWEISNIVRTSNKIRMRNYWNITLSSPRFVSCILHQTPNQTFVFNNDILRWYDDDATKKCIKNTDLRCGVYECISTIFNGSHEPKTRWSNFSFKNLTWSCICGDPCIVIVKSYRQWLYRLSHFTGGNRIYPKFSKNMVQVQRTFW